MPATVTTDRRLLAEAMRASGLASERETVELALLLLVARSRQAAARDLFGRMEWNGDLDAEREDSGR